MVAGSTGPRLAATAEADGRRSVALWQSPRPFRPCDHLAKIPDAPQPEHAYWLREVGVSDLPLVDRVRVDAQGFSDLGGTGEMLGSPHDVSLEASHPSCRTYLRAHLHA